MCVFAVVKMKHGLANTWDITPRRMGLINRGLVLWPTPRRVLQYIPFVYLVVLVVSTVYLISRKYFKITFWFLERQVIMLWLIKRCLFSVFSSSSLHLVFVLWVSDYCVYMHQNCQLCLTSYVWYIRMYSRRNIRWFTRSWTTKATTTRR